MTDYSFTAKFEDAPTGPFTSANKALVWPPGEFGGTMYDPDPGGKFFELVDDDRLGGRCCRMKYPKGSVGMGSQFYQLRIKSPKAVANIEFDWLAEDGFQFNTSPENKVGGGKMGPCVNWGEVGGDDAKRGTRPMFWWNAQGSNNAAPVFSPSTQDQRTGSQLIQPIVYTKPIECERVYKFKISILGGPSGWTKHYQDGAEIASVSGQSLQASPDDDVIFDFAFFSGGAGDDYAPDADMFARHGNVRFWSGEEAPPGPAPSPAPDDKGAGFTVTLEGKAYSVSGSWILTAKEG